MGSQADGSWAVRVLLTSLYHVHYFPYLELVDDRHYSGDSVDFVVHLGPSRWSDGLSLVSPRVLSSLVSYCFSPASCIRVFKAPLSMAWA